MKTLTIKKPKHKSEHQKMVNGMKRTPLCKVSVKQRAELAKRRKVRIELEQQANGHCQNCGHLPDWRGLQMHHKKKLSQGGETSVANCELWCAPCHFGKDGHRTEM